MTWTATRTIKLPGTFLHLNNRKYVHIYALRKAACCGTEVVGQILVYPLHFTAWPWILKTTLLQISIIKVVRKRENTHTPPTHERDRQQSTLRWDVSRVASVAITHSAKTDFSLNFRQSPNFWSNVPGHKNLPCARKVKRACTAASVHASESCTSWLGAHTQPLPK